MTQPPVELTYGTLKWWVASLTVDTSADANDLPELSPVNGKVYVIPNVPADGLFLTGVPVPLTLLKTRIELRVVNGRLQDLAGNEEVKLLANDSPGLAQTGWLYRLEFELDDGLTFGSFSFSLATGETVDLTLAAGSLNG